MTAKPKTSKRQQLKALQSNDLNKTPQQPRIKSAAQRAKTDILQSGLGLKAPSEKNKPQQLLNPDLDLNSPEVKFGRSLASSDASGRHKSVNKLKFYLKARCDIANENGGFSELDLMKLWKGLWYCLYMADKVPVQDELSKRLSELIWCFEGTEEEDEYAARMYLEMAGDDDDDEDDDDDDELEDEEGEEDDDHDVTMKVVKNTLTSFKEDEDMNEDEVDESDESDEEMMEGDDENVKEAHLMKHCRGAHLAALFIRTFFATVRREWGNMDKYRVDKFYTLVRLMMGEVYKYMAKRHWNYGITRLFNDHLHAEILSQIPNGIRYHIIDLALDQLAIVNKKYAPLPLTESTYVEVLEPFFGLCQFEQNATVQSRAVEKVLKKFLYEYSVVGDKFLEENKDEDDEDDYTFDNVHVGSISEFIFSLASHEGTKDKYRETLYAIFKEYEKRLKKVGKDVEVEVDDDMDEEEHMVNEDIDETQEDETLQKEEENVKNETSIEQKKSKGKKSKKNKRMQQSEETTVDNVEPQNQEQPSQEANKKKKRKKSQKNEDDTDVATEKTEDKDQDDKNQPKNSDSSALEAKKKQKKSKKKKKNTEDEVFVISASDQKQAMEASTSVTNKVVPDKTKKKKSKVNIQAMADTDKVDDADDKEDSNESMKSRRVSFGKMNHSKSYKASMKGLKTMEHPGTALRTPEKGILLKKIDSESKASSEKDTGKKKRNKKSKKAKK